MRRVGVIPALCLGGCAGVQNALGGQGAEDSNFIRLFTLFMVVCTAMYVIVTVALIAALWRQRKAVLTIDDRRHHQTSNAVTPALIGWTILIAVGTRRTDGRELLHGPIERSEWKQSATDAHGDGQPMVVGCRV
jgi:heme/copper-type cytochrome/quinol oxidase subunit 2